MDQLKGALGSFGGGDDKKPEGQQQGGNEGGNKESSGGGGFLGGIGDKLNSAAGGGKESEKNEDYLDKGTFPSQYPEAPSQLQQTHSFRLHSVSTSLTDHESPAGVDFVQEKFMGGGAQDNESAVEQAKDEQISDFIRSKYKSTTGSDIPIKDKETRLG